MFKPLIVTFLGLSGLPGFLQAAEIYRWVDERGVTQYSEKPPANRPAKVIDGRPAAASVDAEGKLVEPQKPVVTAKPAGDASGVPPGAIQPGVAPPPPPPGAVATDKPVRGMEFATFIYLQRGMTEGEVLLRAGRPDHESVENFRNYVVKSLYYYPTTSNPFITVITLRGGRVAEIERNRKTF